MNTKRAFLSLWVALSLMPAAVTAQQAAQRTPEELLQQRKALAERGTFLYRPAAGETGAPAVTSSALGDALDIPPDFLTDASISGPPAAAGIFPGLGVIHPKRGPEFVLLSTGVAGTFAPEPGTDFAPIGTPGDQVTLTLQLNLPPGATRLSFDFNFLSAEFPDYVGTIFNDSFSAVLTDSSGVREIARSSVNSAAFIAASASNAGGSGFDIFTEDPADVDTDFSGGLPDAGLTGFQSVNVPLAGGGPATLTFSIADLGDGILDSAVILDNLVISSVEIVDPNPQFLSGGEVIGNPETLAKDGDPREAAAADGVTKVLLRASVEGPGTMQFCLQDAIAPRGRRPSPDRRLRTRQLRDGSRGQYIAGIPGVCPLPCPAGLQPRRRRGAQGTLLQLPWALCAERRGLFQESETPFKIVRPPVVLVHGLWSGSGTWTFPLATDERLAVTLADYTATNASHFSTNLLVPFTYIREAVVRERLNNDAATQVDIGGPQHRLRDCSAGNHHEPSQLRTQ